MFIRPLYKKISNLANAEIFAATTLLVVLGTSFMTQIAGEETHSQPTVLWADCLSSGPAATVTGGGVSGALCW